MFANYSHCNIEDVTFCYDIVVPLYLRIYLKELLSVGG